MTTRMKVVRIDPEFEKWIHSTREKLSKLLGKQISLGDTQRIIAESGMMGQVKIINMGGKKRKIRTIDDMVRF